MSASFNPEDRDWLKSIIKLGHFSKLDNAMIETAFDEQTDYDVAAIEKVLKQDKYLRRVCLYKLIVFPLEYCAIRTLLGKDEAREHLHLVRLYKAFYKKQISHEVFQENLNKFMKKR